MSDPFYLTRVPLDPAFSSGSPSFEKMDSKRLEESCSEMEALFIQYLLKEMRATIPKSGLMSGGTAEEMYTSILDIQLAKEIAARREIGISSMLFRQLSDSKDQDESDND